MSNGLTLAFTVTLTLNIAVTWRHGTLSPSPMESYHSPIILHRWFKAPGVHAGARRDLFLNKFDSYGGR